MKSKHLEILKALCNLPTAPYCEQHVIAWLLAWARQQGKQISVRRDRAGNVHLEYVRGARSKTPLVIEAHMDHPGFVVKGRKRDGTIVADFRGTVKPSHIKGGRAKFWVEETRNAKRETRNDEAGGRWVVADVLDVKSIHGRKFLDVRLKVRDKKAPPLPPGTLGMWDLPDAAVKGEIFSARVCDDLGGVAAMICLLEELIARKTQTHVIGLCSRAEEVAFAGVLAVCENGWIPKGSRVIGLETSKASAASGGAAQGGGAVVRVGDRIGIFSAGLTHFISQAAGHISDDDSSFKYQRRLMDGGTCNSTAFLAWGYDSAAMCVALGNYHNQTVKGEIGWGDGAKAGPGIASETIHLGDFEGMVRILIQVAETIGKYKPGFGAVRERFAKMHREEQVALLYAKS